MSFAIKSKKINRIITDKHKLSLIQELKTVRISRIGFCLKNDCKTNVRKIKYRCIKMKKAYTECDICFHKQYMTQPSKFDLWLIMYLAESMPTLCIHTRIIRSKRV